LPQKSPVKIVQAQVDPRVVPKFWVWKSVMAERSAAETESSAQAKEMAERSATKDGFENNILKMTRSREERKV
jgi:hypothetical protein